MASSLCLQSLLSLLPPNHFSSRLFNSFSSISTNPSVISSNFPQISAKNISSFKFRNVLRATQEGVPNELIKDSKFVPLNADDPRYGPPALLLLGFRAEETVKIQLLLQELDGDFMKIIHCAEEMITQSLWEAMNIQQPNLGAVKIAESLPRICILSGLSGEEMMMFIDAFAETGLEPAAFAALVPNSANKQLREVMEEIMGDHEMLSEKQEGPS